MRQLRVRIGCGDQPCEARLTGRVVAKRAKGRRGRRVFKVKPKTVPVPAGERQAIRLKLRRHNKSIRKLGCNTQSGR